MSLEELNQQLDHGLRVYHHFLGPHLKTGKHYKSPFGHDGRPSFNLFQRGDGHVAWCDHAMGDDFQGSCYDFVGKLYGVDFKESIRIIKREILGLSAREIEGAYAKALPTAKYKPLLSQLVAETVSIKAHAREWLPGDLDFFAATGIGIDTLAKYHCYALESYEFSKGGRGFTLSAKVNDPMYGYHFPLTNHMKIYRPFAADKRYKWISNVDARQDVFGWDTLPERTSKLYLCAGQRDTMALHALTGLPCLALNSETAKLSPELYQLLSCVADEVLCCLDNDITGLKAQEQMRYDWGIYDAGREVLDSFGMNDLSEVLGECGDLQRLELKEHFCAYSVRKLSV